MKLRSLSQNNSIILKGEGFMGINIACPRSFLEEGLKEWKERLMAYKAKHPLLAAQAHLGPPDLEEIKIITSLKK